MPLLLLPLLSGCCHGCCSHKCCTADEMEALDVHEELLFSLILSFSLFITHFPLLSHSLLKMRIRRNFPKPLDAIGRPGGGIFDRKFGGPSP